jgi:hypothetical protein
MKKSWNLSFLASQNEFARLANIKTAKTECEMANVYLTPKSLVYCHTPLSLCQSSNATGTGDWHTGGRGKM